MNRLIKRLIKPSALSLAVAASGAGYNAYAQTLTATDDPLGYAALDTNNDGSLDEAELMPLANRHTLTSDEILAQYDSNDDSRLAVAEFEALQQGMTPSALPVVAPVERRQPRPVEPDELTARNAPAAEGTETPAQQQNTAQNAAQSPQSPTQRPREDVTAETNTGQQASKDNKSPQRSAVIALEHGNQQLNLTPEEAAAKVRDQMPEGAVTNVGEQPANAAAAAAERTGGANIINDIEDRDKVDRVVATGQVSASNWVDHDSVYNVPVSDLRNAQVIDAQGLPIGRVEDVVVDVTRHQAGFIVQQNADAEPMFALVEHIEMADKKVMINADANIKTISDSDVYDVRKFRTLPPSARTLGDVIHKDSVSAR